MDIGDSISSGRPTEKSYWRIYWQDDFETPEAASELLKMLAFVTGLISLRGNKLIKNTANSAENNGQHFAISRYYMRSKELYEYNYITYTIV